MKNRNHDGGDGNMSIKETRYWMQYYHDKMIEHHNKLVEIKKLLGLA